MKQNLNALDQQYARWFDSEITPECELILRCSRLDDDQSSKYRIMQLLENKIDWDYVEIIATRNQVLPLLYHNLKTIAPDVVPSSRMKIFEEEVKRITKWNEDMQEELLKTLELFKENSIQVIPFKGITFILHAYGSLSLRPTEDLDIFVRRNDFLRAKDLLIRHGYNHVYFGHHEVVTVQNTLMSDRIYNDLGYHAFIDLHYSLSQQYMNMIVQEIKSGSVINTEQWLKRDERLTFWFFNIDSEPMWRRLNTITVNGIEIKIFSPEDMLFICLINGIKENWQTLRRICDLTELVRVNQEMNWDGLINLATELRCKRKFFFGLMLAYRLLDMRLPEEIRNRYMSSNIDDYMATQAIVHISRDVIDHRELGDFQMFQNIVCVDNMNDCVKILLCIVRQIRNPEQRFSSVRSIMYIMKVMFRHALKIVFQWLRYGKIQKYRRDLIRLFVSN